MKGAHPVKQEKSPSLVVAARTQPTWNELGESFETMGKLSLALAVGLSAAGLFCKLADQGKVKIPTLSGLLAPRSERTDRSIETRSERSREA